MIHFAKYQALGNDYIVIDPHNWCSDKGESTGSPSLFVPSVEQVRRICDRHYGAGSDGILWGPLACQEADFAVRIFNPDGSEAEKSGNGLRIFSRYLWDRGRVGEAPFRVRTAGGIVSCRVHPDGSRVTVEMGRASFDSQEIPLRGPRRDVINEEIEIEGRVYRFCAVTMGNPHCVLLCDEIGEAETRRIGPLVERNALFPNRTNVQFLRVIDSGNLQIEIWERGAGFTLASGSSSCAATAAAYRLGLCCSAVKVHMPGGVLDVAISPDWSVTLSGAAEPVYDGNIHL